MTHGEALATKPMVPVLEDVLDRTIRIINFTKPGLLQDNLFEVLCKEMSSPHTALIIHTEVCCLPRERILTRLLELCDKILVFLHDDKVISWSDCVTKIL